LCVCGHVQVGPNALRNAHSNSRKGTSAAERKTNEIWFRKCGHGERLFVDYYGAQPGVVPPDQWDAFQAILSTPLPVTFRLHGLTQGGGGRDGEAQAFALALLRQELEKDLAKLHPLVSPVAWAPKAAGIYQAAVDKRALSKNDDAHVRQLAELLADSVACGLLNRQEAVSMLPVLALQVEAGMCCLDMCASPGSKTMQLLEAVSSAVTSNGLVVANDAHPKRVHQLIDTIERHSRPAAERARFVVTCHRGEAFPMPYRPFVNTKKEKKKNATVEEAGKTKKEKEKKKATVEADDESLLLGFDRVLCDVPCSGDGTIRKDSSVQPRWTPNVVLMCC